MISFRARAPHAIDWDLVTFDGENEDLLSHLFSEMLATGDWEVLVSRAGGDYEPLDDV